MAIWAIKSYDNFYGGLQGRINYEIFEGTEKEADECGLEMSYEVIESYHNIYDSLEDSIREYCEEEGLDYDENGEGVENIREEVYGEDTAWDIHQLNKSKLPTLDFNKLNNMFYNNPDEFLKKYAIN